MPKTLLFLAILVLSSSCATVFNRKKYSFTIKSDGDYIKVGDSIYKVPAKVKVMRSKDDLIVTALKDSLKKEFTMKSSLDPFFVFGNACMLYGAPVGYLVDLTNKKRFYYGWGAELNTTDTSSVYVPEPVQFYRELKRFANKKFPTKAGQINFTASMPYVNAFYFKPDGESAKSESGFFGIGTGLEYFYRDNKYLSFSVAAAVDLPIPIPAPIDRASGPYETMNSIYFSATNNRKFGRLSLGYGLNFSRNRWSFHRDTSYFATKVNYAIGITTKAQLQVNRYVFVGLTYQPTLLKVPTCTFSYEHLLSLEFAFKIKVRRPKWLK